MEHPSYIHDLAIVLGVAAVMNILFKKLKQPSILGYLLAGLIVGPYLPIPLFADVERIQALSEFGVVLVMFVLGLEFQLSKLFRNLPVTGFTALIQIGSMMWLGFFAGETMGWNHLDSVFLGGSIAISSTMIVTKVFEAQPVARDVREFVLGILILQDVAAIALIAAMTAIAESGTVSLASLSATTGKLVLTLALFIAGGLLIVPRLFRALSEMKSKETLVIASVGLCFFFSLLAEAQGYSVALGAFVAGLLVSESGKGYDIEHLITPLKDMFAAIFFVSIGMTVDPRLAWDHMGASLFVFSLVLFGQFFSVSLGGVLSGIGIRKSLTSGLALGQIGEFAFIIAAIGTVAGVVDAKIQPVLVTVAILSSFTTPFALKKAKILISWVDRSLPERLKNLLVVYDAWFENLRTSKSTPEITPMKRIVRVIIFDTLAWVVMLLAAAFWATDAKEHLVSIPGVQKLGVDFVFLFLIFLLSIPPLWGITRNTNHLVQAAEDKIAAQKYRTKSPVTQLGRGFLRAAIRLAVLLGAGLPVAASFHPLVSMNIASLLFLLAVLTGLSFVWQAAGRLNIKIKAESERLVDFLSNQRSEPGAPAPATNLFAEFGQVSPIEIAPGSGAVGKSLSELNLRAATGALVITIHREGEDLVMPKGSEHIRGGDLLFIAGSASAITEARQLLEHPEESDSPEKPAPTI